MESKTKVQLSLADIQNLVSHAFGENIVSAREMKDGWFNTTYHIAMGDGGKQTVLKVGPPLDADVLTYEKDLLRAEVETMKLAATNPQIPVPRITFDDQSRSRIPYPYYFMDFLAGTTWDKIHSSLTEAQNNAIEYQLGQITAQINGFRSKAFGFHSFGREFDNWPDAFRWMCEILFADAGRYSIEPDLSAHEFFDSFDEHHASFAEVLHPQLVHWDLWPGNIFITLSADDPGIEGVVDFERALWGDPLMESYLTRQSGIPHYMAGYGENMFATRSQRIRRTFYDIYLHLIMIIEDGPRQYDDKRMVNWARQQLQRDMKMLHHGDFLEGDN